MQKFLRFLMLAALFLPFAMRAQNTLTVADGTSTNSYVPIYGYWADSYLRCQTIYPASELDAAATTTGMNGGTITSLTYYLSSPAAEAWTGTWEVKLMEVTATTLSAFLDMTNATTVYTGSLDGTQSPLTITFATPYTYNGGNLLIEVSQTTSGNYKSASFYGVSATGASWQGYNSSAWSSITGSAQNFIPKTTFTFTGGSTITCRPVQNLTIDATQTTSNSLTLTWIDTLNSGASYTVYDLSNNDVIESGITPNTYTVNNLAANTVYSFGVEANCSATDASVMMTTSGRTACAALSELPFNEGFESVPSGSYQMPFCWERYTSAFTTSTTYPYSYSGGAHAGSRSLYYYGTTGSSYPDTMIAIMPELDVTLYPMNGNRVTFWAKMGSTSYNKNVYVYTMTNPADITTLTLVDSVLISGTDHTRYSVSLTNANANDPYVAFMVLKGNGTIYIDDVTLELEPNCPDVTGLTLDNQNATGANISWNDNGAGSFEVEVRQNGTALTDVTVVVIDTTAEISGLQLDNDYEIYVRAICGTEVGSWTSALSVHIGFCLPNPTSVDGSGITSVTFGGMTNNTTHPTTAPYYGNYSSMSGTVPAGLPTDIEITYATGYTYGTIIWVDWNNSLSFDADEVVYRGTSESSNPTTLTATFNVPASAAGGTYRMRIAGADSYFDTYVTNPTSTPNPCFESSWAIAEDYTLVVGAAPSCTPVENLTISNITEDGATLSWNGNANSYTIYNMSDSSEVATVNNTTYTLSLNPMTHYSFGVVSNCGSDQSIMMTVSFTTACVAIELPYTETFESTSESRDCWNLVASGNIGGSNGMGFVTVSNREVLRFSSYNTASDYNQYGFSPLMDVSSEATNLSVNITYATYSSANILNFGYVTATDTVWDPTDYTTTGSSDWQNYTAIIPTTATQIAIHYYGNYSFYAWIDSVEVSEMTGDYCYTITDLAVDSVTNTSAFLSWSDENNSGATYTIYDMSDNTVIASNISSTDYEVTGLTAHTSYTFGVVANCSATSESAITTVTALTDCENGSCMITIIGEDSWGDGWNGNAINIIQDNVTIGTFTLASGNSLTESFVVCSASPVSFSWVAGSYPSEVSFEIFDGGNTSVYSGAGSSMVDDSVFFTLNDACPSCIAPAVTVGNVDQNSVTLNWTGNADSYDLYQDGTFVDNVTTNTYTFNGLADATNYTFGVQAICSATDSSFMVNVNVMTSCPDVTVLPYYEGFENDLGCWTTINGSSDGQPWYTYNCAGISTVNPHGGAYVASSWSWNNSAMHADAWLISPRFVLPSTTDSISFSWWQITNPNYRDHYSVVLSTTTNNIADFTTVLRPSDTASGTWTMQTVDLTQYAGQSVYIAFHHLDYNENYLLIDDIALYQGAYTPPAPDTLTVTFAVNDATMGTTDPVPGTYQYISGDTVSFTAIPNTGYIFTGWEMDLGTEVDTFPANYISAYFLANSLMSYGSLTLTALFEADAPTESLTIYLSINDPTLGTINPVPGTYVVALNDSLVLSATPAAGATFDGWKISVGTQTIATIPINPFTIPVNSNNIVFGELNVVAMFSDSTSVPDSITVIVNTADATMGTTNPAPGTYHYAVGSQSFLAAIPNPGYHNLYWIEEFAIAGMVEYDTLYADTVNLTVLPIMAGVTVSITAYFEANEPGDFYNVSVTSANTSMGTVTSTASGSVAEGTQVTATATALEGYRFVNWTDAAGVVVSTANPYNFTVTADVTLIANFELVDAIEDITLAQSINLMPNPADNYIELRINSSVNVKEAVIYNAFGQMIQTVVLTDNHARIDLSNMASGMYFVRINGNNVTATKKFIRK